MAETWDLKASAPANHPTPLCALLQCGLLPLPACQRVNLPAMLASFWPTGQPFNGSTSS